VVACESVATTMGATGAGESSGVVSSGAHTMGATIRALRRRAGFSQAAFGSLIGMHRNYFGVIERGGVPNVGLETVQRIAGGLDVSIAVLAVSYVDPVADGEPLGRRVDAPARPTEGWRASDGARELGRAIRALRLDRELTQAELAEQAAMHRSHLASIEAGEKPNPGIATIASIACGLRHGDREPPLLPLLAQTFTGELTVAELRTTVAATRPSGSQGARPFPPGVTP